MSKRIIIYFLFCFALTSNIANSYPPTPVPPVMVRAKKTTHYSPSQAPKTVITQKDLIAAGATSLTQALQTIGEIQLQDTTGNGSQVILSMRGFGANAISNTLLLVNGIPITNPDLSAPDLNTIPIQEIKFIEIISGSESVLYGDQAVGGIINIVTREQTKDKIGASCGGGSYHQHNCYVTVSNHIKQLKYDFAVLNSHTDNYRDHNDYDQNLLLGGFAYPYQTGNINFNYKIAQERMLYPGALTSVQVAQNRRQASNNTDFFKNWNGFFHLKQQQKLNSHWQLETNLASREMNGNGVLFADFSQSRTIHFIKPQLTGTLGPALFITGIDLEDDRYHLKSLLGTTHDKQQKYGVFGLVTIPMTSRLSLSIGAREAQQNNYLETTTTHCAINRAAATTLGTLFQLNANSKIYLRRAESFRFPKADENASTSPGVNGLKTQKGISYETGTEWNDAKSTSKISVYQLNLQNEIAFDPTQTEQRPFGSNRNLAPTVRRGISLSEKYQITKQFMLAGQYNYIHASFQNGPNAGRHIPLVAENSLHANINYRITPNWNIYTEAVYTGNQYPANDDANSTGKMGGYTLYNLNLRYHLKNLIASFRINNIFNKNYYFYTVFEPGMQSAFFYPAPGRNVLLTIQYLFL